jgi:hypothetical protein
MFHSHRPTDRTAIRGPIKFPLKINGNPQPSEQTSAGFADTRKPPKPHAINSTTADLNENGRRALVLMTYKKQDSDNTGPMGMQPFERGPFAPTEMQPMMPSARRNVTGEPRDETETPAPKTKQRTRTEAVRAALARIMRRNSLRKQRQAQKR